MRKCSYRGNKLKPEDPSWQSRLLLSTVSTPSDYNIDFKTFIASLRDDTIKEFVKVDTTLMAYGNSLFYRKGITLLR